MENTKANTTDSSTSLIHDEPSGVAILTSTPSSSLTASTPGAEKEIGTQAPPESDSSAANHNKTQKKYEDAPPQGTPQEWAEVVYQFAMNAKDAGLPIILRTILIKDVPHMIFTIPNGAFCVECGHPNLGPPSEPCHNPRCAKH